jgi:hypothetical protein
MKFLDKDQFREDLKAVFSKEDVEILIQLYKAKHCPNPTDEVAKALGMTAVRIKQRTLKSIDFLRRMAGYAVLLERAAQGDDSVPVKPKAN